MLALGIVQVACSFDPTGPFSASPDTADADVVIPGDAAAPVPGPDAAPALRAAFNVAGPEVVGVDFPGVWAAGGTVCSGNQWRIDGDIFGTDDDPLFRDYAYELAGGTLSCAVGEDLPAGIYQVTLVFGEVWYGTGCDGAGGVGTRVFDIAIEGTVRDEAVDTVAVGGCCAPGATDPGAPFTRTFTVDIDDGVANVDLVPTSDNTAAMISAIELTSVAP